MDVSVLQPFMAAEWWNGDVRAMGSVLRYFKARSIFDSKRAATSNELAESNREYPRLANRMLEERSE